MENLGALLRNYIGQILIKEHKSGTDRWGR
jgi:hypothetical protein